jgi:TRAP-type uncharacterized transport system fused permease subunit
MLVAVGAVPALLTMGVPLLAAHFFCFYFAICSHITPPVAIGALVASQIAGGEYWETAWEAVKAAFAKYLLPFFFIYTPVVILRPEAGFLYSAVQMIAILIVIISLQIGVSNFCFKSLLFNERLAFIIVSILCLIAVFIDSAFFYYTGGALFIYSLTRQAVTKRNQR